MRTEAPSNGILSATLHDNDGAGASDTVDVLNLQGDTVDVLNQTLLAEMLAQAVISNGTQDDDLVNVDELIRGLDAEGYRIDSNRVALQTLVDAYTSPGKRALSGEQVVQAIADGALVLDPPAPGVPGVARVDVRSDGVVTQFATDVIHAGSLDGGWVTSHASLDQVAKGLRPYGFEGKFSRDMLEVLFTAYSGDARMSISELQAAITDGGLALDGKSIGLNYQTNEMSGALAAKIIEKGSNDDGRVNRSELRAGLESIGFDNQASLPQLEILALKYGDRASKSLDQAELASAIQSGTLRLRDNQASINDLRRPDSFAGQTFGTEPQTQDRVLLELAAAAYNPRDIEVHGWSRLSDDQLTRHNIDPTDLIDDKSSFKAGIYVRDGKYVLAFAGTEDTQDWINNGQQGVGFDAKQYAEAKELAAKAKTAFGDQLVLTGHSLGGGLAANTGLAVDAPAVTFNPAGVHSKSLDRSGLNPTAAKADAEAGMVRRYVVQYEILDEVQRRTPIPTAPGHRIQLDDPIPQNSRNPKTRIEHSVELHSIGSIRLAMDGDPTVGPVVANAFDQNGNGVNDPLERLNHIPHGAQADICTSRVMHELPAMVLQDFQLAAAA